MRLDVSIYPLGSKRQRWRNYMLNNEESKVRSRVENRSGDVAVANETRSNP